jgi:UDP-N-acetylmuramoyl-L-alanyl-D-glutamate--2,6-diaminopimelate ligase
MTLYARGPEGPTSVRLSDLARLVPGSELVSDCEVADLTHDSRQAGPGSIFCALRGRRDGHLFASEAISRGASGIVVDRAISVDAPTLRVPSVRHAIGRLASAVNHDPSSQIPVVGITGTNGKTTSAHLLYAILTAAGRSSALIGTIETRTGSRRTPAMLTTPQAPDLQRLLAEAVTDGAKAAVMEVSSHGLDQHRVDGTLFEVAVFLNLTPEHLDYHGTVEQYYASKALLFEPDLARRAVVCVDDEWGQRLAHQVRVPVLTFGQNPQRDGTCDVQVQLLYSGLTGTAIRLFGAGIDTELEAPVIGDCNVANVAASYLCALELGIDPETARRGLAVAPPVPGRFELVEEGQPFLVVVDYAHTPDALLERLREVRRMLGPGGRVRLVVGARGGRDRLKRQDLGRAAARADEVYLTTDSAGTEAAERIIDEIRLGILSAPPDHLVVEPDRRTAIELAVDASRPGDVLLITGRGHEVSQLAGDTIVPLDDREAARAAVRRWNDPEAKRHALAQTP